jgi:hypothetical protein
MTGGSSHMPNAFWNTHMPAIEIDQRSREQRLQLEQLQRRSLQYLGNREPALEELLEDPIVHLLMTSDGVSRRGIWALMGIVRRRLQEAVKTPQVAENPSPFNRARRDPEVCSRASASTLARSRPHRGPDVWHHEPLRMQAVIDSHWMEANIRQPGCPTKSQLALKPDVSAMDACLCAHAALHELAERLTAINNYLAAALRLSDADHLPAQELPGYRVVLTKAQRQADLATVPVAELRRLLAAGVPPSSGSPAASAA